MTLEEYEQIVSNDLVNAHNNKNMTTLIAVFKEADETLKENNINLATRKRFWEEVRQKVVNSSRLLIERQANSALIALMQAIEKEIAVRTAK